MSFSAFKHPLAKIGLVKTGNGIKANKYLQKIINPMGFLSHGVPAPIPMPIGVPKFLNPLAWFGHKKH